MKRKVGEVWKEDRVWKVQGHRIIFGVKLKRDAVKVSKSIKESEVVS